MQPIVVWDDGPPGEARRVVRESGLPFQPISKADTWLDEESGRTYSTYEYKCPKLDHGTGRCTIYEDRPQLCRTYEPRQDGLCVHFHALEGVDLTGGDVS
jgi:Fe-S-cluster containining protein